MNRSFLYSHVSWGRENQRFAFAECFVKSQPHKARLLPSSRKVPQPLFIFGFVLRIAEVFYLIHSHWNLRNAESAEPGVVLFALDVFFFKENVWKSKYFPRSARESAFRLFAECGIAESFGYLFVELKLRNAESAELSVTRGVPRNRIATMFKKFPGEKWKQYIRSFSFSSNDKHTKKYYHEIDFDDFWKHEFSCFVKGQPHQEVRPRNRILTIPFSLGRVSRNSTRA